MGYTSAQAKKFIEEIAPHAQKAYKKLGKVLPSVCIGIAIVESASGTSSIMRKNNAFLGHKVGSGKTATKYWSGKFFVARTKEEYTIGTHTVIKDAFRAFDSTEQCIFNFYELLNTSLYKGVQSGVDYKTQMSQIKKCGYMTSSTEVNSVISIINKYDLTKYDTYTVAKTVKKSNEAIAKEVIDGKWGNGAERKNRLTQAGYNYTAIQSIVNQLLRV